MLKLTKELDKKFKSAVSVLENDDKFRIITHYDADGISAASVLALTMMKAQKGFHVRFVEKVPEKIPTSLPLIFTDIGNSHLKRISEQEVPVIILDHHYVPDNINGERDDHVYINPHDLGIDGAREVSGGTLSLILSTVYDDINWDLAIYGLSGAAADKQNINGFVGLNSDILKEAIKREKILVKEGLYIDGDNIKDALMKACDPYFPTISGREDRIDELLKKIGIDSELKVNELSPALERKLNSILVISLLERDIPTHVINGIRGQRYFSSHSKIDVDLLYKIMNSCARNNRPGLGLSLCVGDKQAYKEAKKLREKYRIEMIRKLQNLEEKGPKKMSYIQYFYEEKKERKGELAGLGMLYLFDQSKPTFALSKVNERVDLSARATKEMVKKGLDLGHLCRIVAKQHGGNGGGHNIAAGATVFQEDIDDFLRAMDKKVGEILG